MSAKQIAMCMIVGGIATAIYLDFWVGAALTVFGFLFYKVLR